MDEGLRDTASKALSLAKQALQKRTTKKICFFHIPKCGGTSLDEAIRYSYGLIEGAFGKKHFRLNSRATNHLGRIERIENRIFQETLLRYHLAHPSMQYLSGHFYYDETVLSDFSDEWEFVTFFRDPVSKWFSHYFFYINWAQRRTKHTIKLSDFLNSRRAHRFGSNYIVRLTDGVSESDTPSEEAIASAIGNLNSFSVVGVLERLDLFERDFKTHFGTRLIVRHRNISPIPRPVQIETITDAVVEQVRELCQPNQLVYEAVLNRIGADI